MDLRVRADQIKPWHLSRVGDTSMNLVNAPSLLVRQELRQPQTTCLLEFVDRTDQRLRIGVPRSSGIPLPPIR
jgi:hypothetical protein